MEIFNTAISDALEKVNIEGQFQNQEILFEKWIQEKPSHVINLQSRFQKALEAATYNKEETKEAILKAQAQAEEANKRKQEAQELLVQHDELIKVLQDLKKNEKYLDQDGGKLKSDIETIIQEFKKDIYFMAALEERNQEKKDAELFKRTVEKQAKDAEKAKKQKELMKQRKETSEEIKEWMKKGGKNTLKVVVDWYGDGIIKSAVRVVFVENEQGNPCVRVTAVKGDSKFKIDQTWLANETALPIPLRKVLKKLPKK